MIKGVKEFRQSNYFHILKKLIIVKNFHPSLHLIKGVKEFRLVAKVNHLSGNLIQGIQEIRLVAKVNHLSGNHIKV